MPLQPAARSIPTIRLLYVAGTMTIASAPLTISFLVNNQSKAYGAALPALHCFVLRICKWRYVRQFDEPTDTFRICHRRQSCGRKSLFGLPVSGALDSDYMISYVAGILTVTQAALIVTADNKTKVYGADLPAADCNLFWIYKR